MAAHSDPALGAMMGQVAHAYNPHLQLERARVKAAQNTAKAKKARQEERAAEAETFRDDGVVAGAAVSS